MALEKRKSNIFHICGNKGPEIEPKVGWHIAGKRGQAKPCLKSTHEDKSDFPQFYEAEAGPVPAKTPASSSYNPSANTSLQPLTHNNITPEPPTEPANMSMAEIVVAQEAESWRQLASQSSMHNLPSLIEYCVNKEESKRLHLIWAKAFHHAGIPPHAIEDDYVRDAIFQTCNSQVCVSLTLCCCCSAVVTLLLLYCRGCRAT